MNQNQRNELKKLYRGQKLKPKDIRLKNTRAFRRLLKPRHRAKKLLKEQKKQANFPQRRFAVLA